MSQDVHVIPHGRRIQELDALRGIAAIAVLCTHYFNFYDYWHHIHNVFDGISKYGSYGVHLFFVISGFVILMTISRCKTLLDFVVSRFSRIFPAYWTAMLVTALVLTLLHSPDRPTWLQVLVGFTMTEKLFGIPHVDGSYWTLNVELSFYFWITIIFLLGWIPRIERVIAGLLSFQLIVALYNRFTDHLFSQGIKVAFLLEYGQLFCAGMIFYLNVVSRGDGSCCYFGVSSTRESFPFVILAGSRIHGWAFLS